MSIMCGRVWKGDISSEGAGRTHGDQLAVRRLAPARPHRRHNALVQALWDEQRAFQNRSDARIISPTSRRPLERPRLDPDGNTKHERLYRSSVGWPSTIPSTTTQKTPHISMTWQDTPARWSTGRSSRTTAAAARGNPPRGWWVIPRPRGGWRCGRAGYDAARRRTFVALSGSRIPPTLMVGATIRSMRTRSSSGMSFLTPDIVEVEGGANSRLLCGGKCACAAVAFPERHGVPTLPDTISRKEGDKSTRLALVGRRRSEGRRVACGSSFECLAQPCPLFAAPSTAPSLLTHTTSLLRAKATPFAGCVSGASKFHT